MKATLVAIALFIITCLGVLLLGGPAWSQDVSDLPQATPDAGDVSREYSAGSEPAVPAWFLVDCNGLAGGQLATCHNAVAGLSTAGVMLVRMVSRVARESAGGFVKSSLNDSYVAYDVLTVSEFRFAKGCANDATCSQSGRFSVFAGRWSQVSQAARCPEFFPAVNGTSQCARAAPPAVFYGVSP